MPYGLRDAELSRTNNLPGASTSAALGVIDIGNSERGDFVAGCELLIESPALTALELDDTEALTYTVEHGDAPDLSDAKEIASGILAIGADGAGSPAGNERIRLPTNVKRYIRVSLANSGDGNPSAKTATAALVF